MVVVFPCTATPQAKTIVAITPDRSVVSPRPAAKRKRACFNHKMQTQLISLRLLSDDELIARVNAMARTTREVSASLIAHLAEMETRKLHLPEGCSSMFTYCTPILRFSDHEAYGRIKAARVEPASRSSWTVSPMDR